MMKKILRSTGRFIFGKVMPRKAYTIFKGPLKGLRFILGALEGEGGGAIVYFNMLETEQTSVFIKHLKQGYCFFDIGANVGYYTLLASRLVGNKGKIIAVEPVVRNISYLYRHVAINKLNNVTIFPAACSDKTSIVTFSGGPNSAMGHIAKNNVFNLDETLFAVTPVVTISIDEIINSLHLKPAVIKIDVEGAELDVLNGMKTLLQTNPPVIFLSLHSDDLRKKCLAFLEQFDYAFELLSSEKNTLFEFLCVQK